MASLSESGSQSEDEQNSSYQSWHSYCSPPGNDTGQTNLKRKFSQDRSPNFYQENTGTPSEDEHSVSSHQSPSYGFSSPGADDGETSPKKLRFSHDVSPTKFYNPTQGFGSHGTLSDSEDSEDDQEKPEGSEEGNSVAKEFIKKPAAMKASYNDFSAKMMAKMGYKAGKGLGRNEQGRVEIVEASRQRGRRGLGLLLQGFEPADVEWNFDKEVVSADEEIEWLQECTDRLPSYDTLLTWIKEGKKKMIIDDETEFCNEQVLKNVLSCKSVFDNLESEEMRRARTKSNPYETIRGVFFQNRAAMKMANMDAVCDFMFTNPKDEYGHSMVGPNELLYFADVCAGPGGFSEYVLWRKKYDAKGFGFTLKGPCDFKLEEFFAAPSEFFEPHYGVNGLEGDGDIYNPDNLKVFREFVWENTDNKGLHFVMADGGFSVEGQENIQEILSKRLYLCQFLCALSVLREGGHFVCKLFDIFTPFSVGLVYLMYRVFRQVSIFKPVTSRPANSERYIICKGMKPEAHVVHDYLFHVNLMLNKFGTTSDQDIREVVPLQILQSDEKFVEYIIKSNHELGKKQAIALAKIKTFAQNPDLHEARQAEIRDQCLHNWNIPDQVRTAPTRSEPPFKRFNSLLKGGDQECFNETAEFLYNDNLDSLIKSIYDYRCFMLATDARWFLLGMGKSHVYKWNGKPNSRWVKVDDVTMELPNNTILEAEFVQELRGEGKGQRRVTAVHIIDALMLCDVDIQDLSYTERIEKVKKFVKALTRPTRSNLAPIRVKDIFRLEEINQIFNKLSLKVVKGSGGQQRLCYSMEQERHYLPRSVVLVKFVEKPWMMALSRSQGRKYFFNQHSQESRFDTPKGAMASFRSCLKNRREWLWEEGVKVHDSQTASKSNKLSKQRILDFILAKEKRH